MTIYLNMRGPYGIETVDEFTKTPDQTTKSFMKEVYEAIRDYHLAGMNVYTSSRPTKDWKNKP